MRVAKPSNAPNFQQLAFARGRVALAALLKAIGVRSGDEVVTQAFTCVAVPEAIMVAGAHPVYVDVSAGGVTMSAEDLALKIGQRTRAVVLQHTFGIPADIGAIFEVTSRCGVPVIEDCCHTLLSEYDGRCVGTFGLGAFYSFEWGKPVTVGLGGALRINGHPEVDRTLLAMYETFSRPSFSRTARLELQYLAFRVAYHPALYWPMRRLYTTLAATGMAETNYHGTSSIDIAAPEFSQTITRPCGRRLRHAGRLASLHRQHSMAVAARFREGISGATHIMVPQTASAVYARYPLFVNGRDQLLKTAENAGIELAGWYRTPVHPLPENALSKARYELGSCPAAEAAARRIVSLPTHRKTSTQFVDKAIDFINANCH